MFASQIRPTVKAGYFYRRKAFNSIISTDWVGERLQQNWDLDSPPSRYGESTGRVARNTVGPALVMNLTDYILDKANQNILITGGSGEGKSLLTRFVLGTVITQVRHCPTQLLIFSFKPHDVYLKMGYPILRMRDNLPHVFGDPESFVAAWEVTYPFNAQGIQASLVPSMLRDLVAGSNSWQGLFDGIRARLRAERDNNTRSALRYIEANAQVLNGEGRGRYHALNSIPGVVFDFAGLPRAAATFYAEFLLRQIWEDLLRNRKSHTVICVEEAHHMLRTSNGMSRYPSIISTMAREIRAFGMMVTATQNVTDVPEHERNQYGTQFAFRSRHADDLQAVGTVNAFSRFALSGLNPHEFIDLQAHDVHSLVRIWSLWRPNLIDYVERELWIPNTALNPPVSPSPMQAEIVTPESVQAPPISFRPELPVPQENRVDLSKVNFEAEVLDAIEAAGATYGRAMARTIAEKHGADPDKVRVRVFDVCKRLQKEGLLDQIRYDTDDTHFVVLYYRPDPKLSPVHDHLVQEVTEMLDAQNLNYNVIPTGQPGVDIVVLDKNGKETLALEVETGLKHGGRAIEELVVRCQDYKKQGTSVLILTPNAPTLSKYQNKGLDVLTVAKFRIKVPTILFEGQPHTEAGQD